MIRLTPDKLIIEIKTPTPAFDLTYLQSAVLHSIKKLQYINTYENNGKRNEDVDTSIVALIDLLQEITPNYQKNPELKEYFEEFLTLPFADKNKQKQVIEQLKEYYQPEQTQVINN